MTKIEMKSKGAALRSSEKKHRRLFSAAVVLLICCLAFVGAVGAEDTNHQDYWDDNGNWVWKGSDGEGDIVIPKLPTALVNPFTANEWSLMKQENSNLGPYPDLTIALNFTTEKLSDSTMADAQLEYYSNWIADFLITVNKTITFEVTGNNGGWGQYLETDSLSSNYGGYFGGFYQIVNNWIVGPSSQITINENTPMPVVATGLGQLVPYSMVFSSVGTFLCGINLTNDYLATNGPVEVTLGLWMLNIDDINEDVDLNDDIGTVTKSLLPYMKLIGEHTFIVDTVDGKPFYVQKWDIEYKDDGKYQGESNPSSYTSSSPSIILKSPVKEGYDFAGWKDENGTLVTVILAGTTGDKKYVATWTKKTYDITFETNGGSSINKQIGIEHNEKVSKPSNPTKEGHTFENWYSNPEFGEVYNFDTPVTEPLTLYANWTANQYTVTFNPNGGSVIPESKTVTYRSSYGELPVPEREGYTFKGWYNTPNVGGGTEFTAASIVMSSNDHTLYAQWEENSVEEPAITPSTSSGSGSEGSYLSYPRTTVNGGLVDFGASKVIKAVLLPEGSSGSVVLKVDTIEKWPKELETEYTFDISVEKLGEGMAYIHFEIPESTLESLGITSADICAYHLVNGEWVKLETTYEVKDGTVFYEAATDSFSPFKLVIEEGAAEPKAEETEPVIPPTEEPEDKPQEELPPIEPPVQPTEPESPSPILAVLAGLGAAAVLRRK